MLVLVGCATGRALTPSDENRPLETLTMRVENQNLRDATLHLLRGGERQALGSIGSRDVQFFDFGWPPGTPLSIEIELKSGERFRLAPFPYTGRDQLRLTIAGDLKRSAFTR